MEFKENEKDFKQKFAKTLKSLREEEGYTQKQMAELLYIAESTYANWEQGRREPSLYQLMKLAYYLEISINTFFEFE